jgi:hypothetical protein
MTIAVEAVVVEVRQEVFFDVVDDVVQRLDELVEVLFIQEDFLLLNRAIIVIAAFPLGDRDVVVSVARRANVEQVGAFPRTNFPCEDFLLLAEVAVAVVVHTRSRQRLLPYRQPP